MTKYEELEQIAYDQKIIIHENCDFANDTAETPVKGLFKDGHIFLAAELTPEDKTCVLAEELGHHFTSAGNITDLHVIANRQQEQVARLWAYNRLIGLKGIVSAFQAGCQNQYELAEFLGVTEPFLVEAIEKYRSIYGISVRTGNHVIIFEPILAVMAAVSTNADTRIQKAEPKKIEPAKTEKPAAASPAPPVEAVTRAKPITPRENKKRNSRLDAALARSYKRSLKAAEALGMDYEDYIFARRDAELFRGY